MIRFTVGGKAVTVFPSTAHSAPVIYLNTFADEGEHVQKALQDAGGAPCTLVTVSISAWEHDMSPWAIPPISKNAAPCTGGADEHLRLLTEAILPKAERTLSGEPVWRGLAGYSLAGLFAVYALYKTDLFARAASVSGSLWYPDFLEYARTQEMKRTPERLYFSLGDREQNTRNPYLKTVQENTQALEAFYRSRGIRTIFQSNPGNHYANSAMRTAAGLLWLLTD